MPEKLISRFEQSPEHFLWSVDRGVATITLNRPERKNPLTFESYAEMRDRFRDLVYSEEVKAVVITGAGENFCASEVQKLIIASQTFKDN